VIGKIMGNRYRILELIGEGGMALVYKAECSLLCRTVAIKVLRPQYASDSEFVERFRREARAAASLSHPHVVNIYDVGQEDGIDYIVMEYIPGDTLKNIIKREAPFPIRRALEYTRQIAEALHHAHQRNIVHRDIKPHNILVTPDGQVKVTDFGIARAISAGSLTQTGMIVGSVQYSSPEQVKGGVVGPQSDLYSLGCVLYELLTGTIPFKGDTSISIALQHLEENITPIREIRPDIPPVVENIISKSLVKDLSLRYPSALAMIKDIDLAQSFINREIPLSDDDLPTQIWKQPVTERDPKPKRNISFVSKLLLWLAASVILTFLGAVLVLNFIKPRSEVVVPDLVGKELLEARKILTGRHLKMKVVNQLYSSDYQVNRIVSQKPAAGFKKRPDTIVEVMISKGPELVKVPDLLGKTQLEAELALDEAKLRLGEILTGTDDKYPEGVVIKQLPETDTQIEQGAGVSITVNLKDAASLIQVPNFIGRPLSEVRAELTALGLVYNQASPAPSNVYGEGIIVDQRPAPYDKVPPGTAMSFIVSSGSH